MSLTTNLNLIGQNTVNLIGSLAMMFSCSPPLAAVFSAASVVFFYASKKFGEARTPLTSAQDAHFARLHVLSCAPDAHFAHLHVLWRGEGHSLTLLLAARPLCCNQVGRKMQKEVQSATAETNGVATQAISLSRLARTLPPPRLLCLLIFVCPLHPLLPSLRSSQHPVTAE